MAKKTTVNAKVSSLEKLLHALKLNAKNHSSTIFNYVVPELWNVHRYAGKEAVQTADGNVIVNPYSFLIDLIERVLLPAGQSTDDFQQSISRLKGDNSGGDWIKKSIAYSMMPRASSGYDHDRTSTLESQNMYGLKETGTFVKTLALLPHLKRMGVDVVYMLPIAQYTRMYKKGEMGSPYGVKNFYLIDEDLFDPITGDELTVNEQFKAFVEACHRLGMRVVLDFIPRTNARDSVLAIDHPEWFYWIKKADESKYQTPWVVGVDKLTVPEPKHAKYIYTSPEVLSFIKLFQENPKSANPKLWDEIVGLIKAHPEKNHLEIIEEKTGLTVAPAFADVMNDPQPAWTDVTFFRMYLDNPLAAQSVLKGNFAPYMLFDVAKSSLNPGGKPNMELWNTLADVIPYYQTEFGVDGMRIDMGHALPNDLTALILKKARAIDPSFCFIAEELSSERAKAAKEAGYNMIIGDGFYMEPRIATFKMHEFMYSTVNLVCPAFACAETHDTPRIAAREGGRTLARLLTVLNYFVPNGVPFINSGQEVYETQPMNTGLDCRPNEAFMLPANDPLNGKLALFDKFAFHYTNEGFRELPTILEKLSQIRHENLDLFTNPQNYVPVWFASPRDPAVGFAYVKDLGKGATETYLIIGHTEMTRSQTLLVDIHLVRERTKSTLRKGQLIFSTHEMPRPVSEFNFDGNLSLWMQPGEVKIIKI